MEKTLIMLWFFLSLLSVQCAYITSAQLVPALYVFGDSTVDAGNNNNLQTKAKANYLPYGIDFNNTPTGRFTNGMTSADIIATFLGLPLPPAYLSLSEAGQREVTTGLNFGSGSCGILPDTGSLVGTCLSFDKQIELFESTIENSVAKEHLAKSIFYISIGSNDYTLNYLNESSRKPEEYAEFLTDEFVKRLQRLYEIGARKFLVNGIGPIGCIPGIIYSIPHTGNCVESINYNVMLYNEKLSSKLKDLQSQLPNSFLTYSDYYKSSKQILDAPNSYGFTNVTGACWDSNAKAVCSSRDRYLFFDNAHITQCAQKIITALCFKPTTVCNPLNIEQLATAS